MARLSSSDWTMLSVLLGLLDARERAVDTLRLGLVRESAESARQTADWIVQQLPNPHRDMAEHVADSVAEQTYEVITEALAELGAERTERVYAAAALQVCDRVLARLPSEIPGVTRLKSTLLASAPSGNAEPGADPYVARIVAMAAADAWSRG